MKALTTTRHRPRKKTVPLVRTKRTQAGYLLLDTKIPRSAIRAALRADRDAR